MEYNKKCISSRFLKLTYPTFNVSQIQINSSSLCCFLTVFHRQCVRSANHTTWVAQNRLWASCINQSFNTEAQKKYVEMYIYIYISLKTYVGGPWYTARCNAGEICVFYTETLAFLLDERQTHAVFNNHTHTSGNKGWSFAHLQLVQCFFTVLYIINFIIWVVFDSKKASEWAILTFNSLR